MLNIVIELWPYGSDLTKTTIGGFQIANDGTGTKDSGNYMFRWDGFSDWQKSVQNHKRDSSAEYLVYLALKQIYDKE